MLAKGFSGLSDKISRLVGTLARGAISDSDGIMSMIGLGICQTVA
jgi:hypothetical protein